MHNIISRLFKLKLKKNSTTTLNENEIDLLVKRTSMTRQQIIDFHQFFLIDYLNGIIKKSDFIKLLKKQHSNPAKVQSIESFCEYFYIALNANSCGFMKFNHFIIMYAISSFGDIQEKISLAFNFYDLDKNKNIDRDEMCKVLGCILDLCSVSHIKEKYDKSFMDEVDSIIKKLDKNGNHVLEFDEFFDGCMCDQFARKILIEPLFNC